MRGGAAERELVRVVLHHRTEAERVAERVGTADFMNPEYRAIFRAVLEKGSDASIEDIAAVLADDAAAVMQELLDEPGAIVDVERTVEGSVAALQVRALELELEEIDRMLPLAADDAKDDLIRRKAQIRRDIQGLGGVGFRHYGKSRS
jgi:replicative DNA helicase